MWKMYCLSCLSFAYLKLAIPVTVQSEASVCGRSLAGIEVSNLVGNMDFPRECYGCDVEVCASV